MIAGKKSMGMKKHGKSGFKNGAGKSPKFRANQKREAEKNEIKSKPPLPYSSVSDLMNNKKG